MLEPPVLDRVDALPEDVSIERRRFDRRREDNGVLLRNVVSAVCAICGGLAVVFLFFAALGAVDIGDAIVATVVAVVLGLVWLAGFYQRQRTQAELITRRDRERRGF
jgi:hypothetical protein